MIRRKRRCLPIESDSSDDDSFQKTSNRFSRTDPTSCHSDIPNTSKRYNMRKRNKVSIITNDESSTSETEEIVHPPRHGSLRALSDYDTCDSTEESRTSQSLDFNDLSRNDTSSSSSDSIIQTRSRKRRRRIPSVSSSDSSDSGVPVGSQRRKKRIKLHSTSSESSDEDFGNDESTSRLQENGRSQVRQNRPNTSRNSAHLRNDSHISESNFDGTHINVILNGRWRMSVGNMDHENWSVSMSQINSDPESVSDDDIRPHVLRRNTRREFQSNTSSSDSEDEIPIRIPKNRVVKAIIESDEDNKSQNENSVEILSDSSDVDEVCPICLNRFNVQEIGKPSNCDHCFCLPCIKEWAKNNNTCPVDRQQFNSIRVLSSIHGNFVEEIPVFNIRRMLNGWGEEMFESDNDILVDEPSSSDDLEELEYHNEDECCVCFMGSIENDMLYCDVCYDVYHLDCIDPPINNFPVGPWLCANCADSNY